ncbi:MAG: DUF6573 family protein [Bacilli bacterium]
MDEIIASYTRAQAIEDGVLIDVSNMAKEAGLTIPVVVTTKVSRSVFCTNCLGDMERIDTRGERLMAAPFADAKFMTGKDKQAVQRNFASCLEQRSLEKMDKRAYNFYHLRCGFIAHYNIHGFRTEYSGAQFLRFLEHFSERNNLFGVLLQGEYSDLGRALHRLARDQMPQVQQEFANRAYNAKVALLRRLADELGYRIVAKDALDCADSVVLVGVEAGGQLTLNV